MFFELMTWFVNFFLKVIDGKLSRNRPLCFYIAFLTILLSSSFSLSAAFATAESCKGSTVLYQILEFFSLSFFAILGFMVFLVTKITIEFALFM